jgi:hypothetical protein
LKIHSAMMDFLLRDVGKNRFPGGLANRKRTVAALPTETIVLPFRILLELVLRFLTNSAREIFLERPQRMWT